MADDETSLAFRREPSTGLARWTIGIVANDAEELAACIARLREVGFGAEDTALLVVQNFGRNHLDCYQAIARFLDEAEGRHLIVLHQDVWPIDDAAALARALADLDAHYPKWALAGNAGYRGVLRPVWRITDPGDADARIGNPPQPVISLDENLLVLRLGEGALAPVRPSPGLSGFHFYATDLCLAAAEAGRSAHAIDWLVRHDSGGSRNAAWRVGIAMLERQWAPRLGHRIVPTPTTLLLFGLFAALRPIRHKLYGLLWRIERRLWWR